MSTGPAPKRAASDVVPSGTVGWRRWPSHRRWVAFPLAILAFASMSEALALARDSEDLASLAARAMTWGVALGFFASGTGVIEILLRRIPPAGFVRLVMHAGAVHAGLICCLVSLLMRKPGGPSLAATLVGFAGTAILGSGGMLGVALALRFTQSRSGSS